MLAIDNERAGKLFEMMGDEEIRELSQSMSSLGTVDSSVIEGLFVEFADQLSSSGSLVGSYDSTERLLYNSLPEDRVQQIMEEIRGPGGDAPCGDKLGKRPTRRFWPTTSRTSIRRRWRWFCPSSSRTTRRGCWRFCRRTSPWR